MDQISTLNPEIFQAADLLNKNGFAFQYYTDECYDGRKLTINNKSLIHFANCSYMGLETNKKMKQAAIRAIEKYGTQNSMSRAMVSNPLYKQCEDNLSKIFPGYPIIYPTTTLSHCSVIPNIIADSDAIILDAYVHNSVRMASQLCKANGTFILQSKHNDIEHIKYLVYRLKKDGYKKIWYLADGVYSMHGDFCCIKEIYDLLENEDSFYAYIDDAHGFGWYGKNGRGFVLDTVDFHNKMVVSGSLSKSMGANGGLILVNNDDIGRQLKFTGQTMIFSGPMQPAILGALAESTRLHLSDVFANYQAELKDRIHYFRQMADQLGLPIVTKHNTPIQLLRIGNLESTYKVLGALVEHGFFAMAVGYPAIQKGDEGIRITLTRYLSKDDINGFMKALHKIIK